MKKNYTYCLLIGLFITYTGFAQFPSPYCEIDENYYGIEEITTITFEDLSFTNTNTSDILVDLTNIYIDVIPGETYSIDLEGNTDGNHTNEFVVFVDWNQNGILDDENEVYHIGSISNSDGFDNIKASATILVPSTAITGSTRARIMKVYTLVEWDYVLNTDPCFISIYDEFFDEIDGSYGQAIDITVNIAEEEEPTEIVYCEVDEDILLVEEITTVEFHDASITNTNTTDVWIDFTSTIANITQGGSYEITVGGNTHGEFNNEFVAFIDWNKNGILDDDGEVFYIGLINDSTGDDNITASTTIEVPTTAELGETRIRITKTFTDEESLLNIDPCYISSYLEMFDIIFGSFGQALDFTVNISATSGIGNNKNNTFNLYPNPTQNILNISGDSSIKEVIVYNIQGQKILNLKDSEISTIDVSTLASGQYIIQINSDEASQTSKFIKK